MRGPLPTLARPQLAPAERAARTRHQAGLTLIETIIGLVVIALIVLFSVFELIKTQSASHELDARRLARQAVVNEIERMHAEPFEGLAASLIGRTFFVEGLPPRRGGEPHGEVEVFLDEGDPDNPARATDTGWVDLNGNQETGEELGPDTLLRYLPVKVDVTYRTRRGGENTVSVHAIIAPRRAGGGS
ncbi:MAG: prepilin-type N-terminal cleavage/methylation domain-containing protein [Planctomycetota bacterium]